MSSLIGWLRRVLLGVLLFGIGTAGFGDDPAPESLPLPRILFETGFEPWEGYNVDLDLSGQNGWVQEGTGGNGVLPGPLAGFEGNVAYIGFSPPAQTNDFLNVWRPIGLKPVGQDLPVVQFTVSLQIFDSTTNAPFFDDFRWSVYTIGGDRLFTLDFANADRSINYLLDDGKGFQPTGFSFRNDEVYDLVFMMNLHRNVWSARVNEVVVVNGAPMTTKPQPLDLGDIDAVWAINPEGTPGDNFMTFDDYQVTAQPVSSIPAVLSPIGVLNSRQFLVRVFGEPGLTYVLESTLDMQTWLMAGSVVAQSPGGYADFLDPIDPGGRQKFFRAYAVAP